jgi:hypothetical protein
MTSRTYERRNGLTQDQLTAVEIVLSGANDTQTAERLGVARETVTRWRLYDPYFQAALLSRRRELWARSTDALRTMMPQATDTLRDQLRVGPNRGRLALDLLVRAGVVDRARLAVFGEIAPDELTPEELWLLEHEDTADPDGPSDQPVTRTLALPAPSAR